MECIQFSGDVDWVCPLNLITDIVELGIGNWVGRKAMYGR